MIETKTLDPAETTQLSDAFTSPRQSEALVWLIARSRLAPEQGLAGIPTTGRVSIASGMRRGLRPQRGPLQTMTGRPGATEPLTMRPRRQ